jgi:hypothetical protein
MNVSLMLLACVPSFVRHACVLLLMKPLHGAHVARDSRLILCMLRLDKVGISGKGKKVGLVIVKAMVGI